MERVDAQGREPWTWVRTQGKGRVFYTAYGHDERTWGKPGVPEPGRARHRVGGRRRAAPQLAAARDARRHLRRRLQRAELRAAHPGPPKFQLPFTPDQAREVHPGAGRVPRRAVRQRARHHQADHVHVRRARPAVGVEAMDYPNEVLNGNPGDDRIKILEDTNGDGRADKFTVFAEHLNMPTSLAFANGGVIVAGAPHFLFLKDTNGDDKADVRQIAQHRLGHSRHARRTVEPAVRPRQPHLGRGRLLRLRRADERQADAVHAGPVPLQAGWQRVRVPDDVDEQHVGARLLRDVRRVRIDGEQRPELVHGDSQSLLRRHPGAARAPAAAARRRAAATRARGVLRRASDHAVHPPGGRVRRLHRRGGSLPVHRARVSRRSTGTASRSSPSPRRT